MRFLGTLILVCTAMVAPLSADEVTDMYHRKVVIPPHVKRVVGAQPPVTYLLYTIDPSLVAALNTPPNDNLRKVLRPDVLKNPVIGAFGEGRISTANPEVLLATRPDLVLSWPSAGGPQMASLEGRLAAAHIPTLSLAIDTLDDYPAAYHILGRALGRAKRCEKLGSYLRTELDSLKRLSASIPPNRRVRVYLAGDRDGLMTAGAHSVHAEAIAFAGGVNVHRGMAMNRHGKEQVSLEQVMLYDPDVILAQDPGFFQGIYRDPRWAGLRAVRNHRVYMAPQIPISWVDQPPTFMRLLGAKWLMHAFYPSLYKGDLASETRVFFKLFFGTRLKDQDLRGMGLL